MLTALKDPVHIVRKVALRKIGVAIRTEVFSGDTRINKVLKDVALNDLDSEIRQDVNNLLDLMSEQMKKRDSEHNKTQSSRNK